MTSVSPNTTFTSSSLHTELVDRDLRQRRLVALSVGLLAGDDADAAVVLEGDVG